MWHWDWRIFILSFIVLLIVVFSFKKAFGINEYLNDYSYWDYDDDASGSVGIRYRMELGSSCRE